MSQPAATSAVTSAPGASLLPDWTGAFTAAHLIWLALFAAAAVAVIAWGVRQKRARRQVEREVERHNADVIAAPPPAGPATPAPPTPPVVEAKLDDGPAAGPVTQLKGLGPKVAARLAELGITTVGQMAALNDDEAAALDAQLGTFSGRMTRDRWQEQARFLAAGDKAGFEAVFGRL